MSDNDAELKISAESSGVEKGMQDAARAVQTGISQMQAQFGALEATFSRLNGLMLGFAAILGGGKAFKSAVDETVEMTKEATKLGKVLGISATEASVLNVALGDIYQTGDQVVTAASKIAKTLATNEAAFKHLGVATRDGNGNFRNSYDILLDVNKALLKFKEGTDRNVEGVKIFGKGWGEVAPLLKLNADLMEQSRQKAEALGLEVGVESVEATSKYRAAMHDVGDVMQGVKKAIGDALMPMLTDLGNWFASYGPQAVDIMKKAMAGLISAFYGIKMAVEIAWNILRLGIQQMVTGLLMFADVGSKALQLDFSGAKASWRAGMAQLSENVDTAFDSIAKSAEENRDKIFAAWYQATDTKMTAMPKTKDGAASTGKDGKEKKAASRVSGWDAELDEMKLKLQEQAQLEGRFYQMSKADEQAYWKEKLMLTVRGGEENIAVRKKVATLGLDILKDQFEAELANLKKQEDEVSKNADKRVDVVRKEVELVKQKYGEQSKEYEAMLVHLIDAQRAATEQMRQIDQTRTDVARKFAMDEIDAKEEAAKLDVAQHRLTQLELLAMQRDFENQRYDIERQAMVERINLLAQDPNFSPVEMEQLLSRMQELWIAHQKKMRDIQTGVNAKEGEPMRNWFSSMESAFSQSLTRMLTFQQGFVQTMRNLWKVALTTFVNEFVSKKVAAWVIGEAAQTSATMTGVAARGAAEQAGAGASLILQAGLVIKKIINSAFETFAGIFSFLSGLMGPAAAGPAAAGMGEVMAVTGSVAFAAKGFDIPAGINPMTQLHEREMVLPSQYADTIRNMAEGGGGQGAAPIYINTSGGDFIHKNEVFNLLRKINRNFVPMNPKGSPLGRVR